MSSDEEKHTKRLIYKELMHSNINKIANKEYRNKNGVLVSLAASLIKLEHGTILYPNPLISPTSSTVIASFNVPVTIKDTNNLKVATISGSGVNDKTLDDLTDPISSLLPTTISSVVLASSIEHKSKALRMKFEMSNQTTITACEGLIESDSKLDGFINVQNFANAIHPGGGCVNGAMAQEEALCNSTTLYHSLTLDKVKAYYTDNIKVGVFRKYTNAMIWSPNVAVFRGGDDPYPLLNDLFHINVVTCPAVNNKVAPSKKDPIKLAEWNGKSMKLMEHRLRCICEVAKTNKTKVLVLGAWGCGVFMQDPTEMANLYWNVLGNDSQFANAFERIIFAIYDPTSTSDNYLAFAKRFGETS
jgi:uncharacterized protein (TIGR02452 family)